MSDDTSQDTKIPIKLITPNVQGENEPTQRSIISLSGKLITSQDGITIGNNYKTLKNMRYRDTHPISINGMTKVQTNALTTYLKVRSASHLIKEQPAETHVLVQAYNTGLTASQVLQNTTAITSTGDFSATALWTDSSGAGIGQFSKATEGQVAYCNEVDSCIWGGNEMRCAAFITSTAAVTDTGFPTDPKDFTSAITNTMQNSSNVAIIGGGNDSNTKFYCTCDGPTTFTDTAEGGGGAKTITAVNATVGTSVVALGYGAMLLNGTTAYCTTPDHPDFNLGVASFTIDLWANFSSTAGIQVLISQWNEQSDKRGWRLYYTADTLVFQYSTTGAAGGIVTVSYAFTPVVGTWYHIVVERSTTINGGIYINGVILGSSWITSDTIYNSNSLVAIGASFNGSGVAENFFNGSLDEIRVSDVYRYNGSYYVPVRQYAKAARTWLVGSMRPLKGVKYYIRFVNYVSGTTMTGKEWNGSTWNSLSSFVDNTNDVQTLHTTGTVTFTSTVGTAKPKYIEGYFLYWYQFTITGGEAEIYYVTLDAPFQQIVDLWDGVDRTVAACYKYTVSGATYEDVTLNIYFDEYDSSDSTTYLDIGDLVYTATTLRIVFTERQTALHFNLVPDKVNTAVACSATISYWNGNAFSSVGPITDGTMSGTYTMAKSGTISWTAPTEEKEFNKNQEK